MCRPIFKNGHDTKVSLENVGYKRSSNNHKQHLQKKHPKLLTTTTTRKTTTTMTKTGTGTEIH